MQVGVGSSGHLKGGCAHAIAQAWCVRPDSRICVRRDATWRFRLVVSARWSCRSTKNHDFYVVLITLTPADLCVLLNEGWDASSVAGVHSTFVKKVLPVMWESIPDKHPIYHHVHLVSFDLEIPSKCLSKVARLDSPVSLVISRFVSSHILSLVLRTVHN